MVFPIYSFWIPQILYCAYHEARQPLRPLYVVGMTLTRLALPLYIFGCPHNVLRLQSDPGICIGLCLGMGLQVRPVPPGVILTLIPRQPVAFMRELLHVYAKHTGPGSACDMIVLDLPCPLAGLTFGLAECKVRQLHAAC